MTLNDTQRQAVERLREWKVGALFMEAGTGKTRVAVQLINEVPDVDFVLWVAPLRTLDNVRTEIAACGGINCKHCRFVGVESISQSDRIYVNELACLNAHDRAFIVMDESLKIKNIEAKRTQRLIEMSHRSEYRLILNGTPLSKNLLDLWAQMEFLSPDILRMSHTKFKDTFCRYTRVTKWVGLQRSVREFVTGYENIDYLYSLIRHYVYECNLQLEIVQNYSTITYKVEGAEREAYNDVKAAILSDEHLELCNNNIFIELTQKAQHAYCTSPDKFAQLDALFKRIPQSDTIIFCKFVASVEACRKRYPQACVLSYQKSAYGLNLQQYNHTVYFDKVWDLALRTQSSRRTYRIGQPFDCHYYDLTGDVKLEGLIDKNISKKVGMTEYFKGKTKEEIYDSL